MAGKLAGASRTRKAGLPLPTVGVARACTLVLYLATALLVAMQRALSRHAHWTYPVFRESLRHLTSGQNLYAHYPAQGYDLFKYSPTFALLFAPFALAPFAVGLAAWDALNALALWGALDRLLPSREATVAMLLVYPELIVATQASQSNALVAALVILAFIAVERDRTVGAAAAIGVGTAIKLFPIAAITMAIPRRRGARVVAAVLVAGAALVALPLLVAPGRALASDYQHWLGVERIDALDRGASVMGLIAHVVPGRWPDWPVQLAGTAILLFPLLLRRERWRDPAFRLEYLCSLLVYVVIFNHQAERPSYVIAASGIVIWWVRSAREVWRTALLALTLVGLGAAPCFLAWLAMQGELAGATRRSAIPARSSPS